MGTCICGRELVCSKCREIPDRCKCEEVTRSEHDYSLIEAQAIPE